MNIIYLYYLLFLETKIVEKRQEKTESYVQTVQKQNRQ